MQRPPLKEQASNRLCNLGFTGPKTQNGWPLPPSASASIFCRCSESLHKTLINTVFCVQLWQLEFPHAYALLLHPDFRQVWVIFLKIPFSENRIWSHLEDAQFPHLIFQNTLLATASGKNHCGNLRSSAPQPSRNRWPTLVLGLSEQTPLFSMVWRLHEGRLDGRSREFIV